MTKRVTKANGKGNESDKLWVCISFFIGRNKDVIIRQGDTMDKDADLGTYNASFTYLASVLYSKFIGCLPLKKLTVSGPGEPKKTDCSNG